MSKKETKKLSYHKKVVEEKIPFRSNSNLEFKETLKDGLLEKYELNAEGATVFVSIEKKEHRLGLSLKALTEKEPTKTEDATEKSKSTEEVKT